MDNYISNRIFFSKVKRDDILKTHSIEKLKEQIKKYGDFNINNPRQFASKNFTFTDATIYKGFYCIYVKEETWTFPEWFFETTKQMEFNFE